MTFDELWEQVRGLPEMAKVQVPSSLSINTKKRLCKFNPEEISKIVQAAIDEINHGSIESLDKLIQQHL